MARFPRTEAEIAALMQDMINGFANHQTVYPAPPVPTTQLSQTMSAYIVARNTATEAQADAELAVAAKGEALEAMVDDMKQDIRYAENTVDYDDEKLKLIGWAGRSKKTPLQIPGQVRSLEAPREGEGWIYLDWKQPVDGGTVASYNIERRERPEGPWQTVSLAMTTETTLHDQDRGKEFEYRVSAVNKAGEGEASNTVMAVL